MRILSWSVLAGISKECSSSSVKSSTAAGKPCAQCLLPGSQGPSAALRRRWPFGWFPDCADCQSSSQRPAESGMGTLAARSKRETDLKYGGEVGGGRAWWTSKSQPLKRAFNESLAAGAQRVRCSLGVLTPQAWRVGRAVLCTPGRDYGHATARRGLPALPRPAITEALFGVGVFA